MYPSWRVQAWAHMNGCCNILLPLERSQGLLKVYLAALCILIAHSASAAKPADTAPTPAIWIVVSDQERVPYARFVDTLQSAVQLPAQTFLVTTPDAALQIAGNGRSPMPRLAITVGTRAAATLCARQLDIPVLLTLIPKPTYDTSLGLACNDNAVSHSAVFLDQPLARQAAAVRLTLPHHPRAAMLLGPESRTQRAKILSALKRAELEPVLIDVDRVADIFYALERAAAPGTVLLALPDPLVFTARTASHILLGAYRYRIPVVGYSESYARAGALLAVFSSPEQMAQQVSEIVRRAIQNPAAALPPPQYPKYFSVTINRQVARSFGLTLPSDAELHTQLLHLEEKSHD